MFDYPRIPSSGYNEHQNIPATFSGKASTRKTYRSPTTNQDWQQFRSIHPSWNITGRDEALELPAVDLLKGVSTKNEFPTVQVSHKSGYPIRKKMSLLREVQTQQLDSHPLRHLLVSASWISCMGLGGESWIQWIFRGKSRKRPLFSYKQLLGLVGFPADFPFQPSSGYSASSHKE